MNNMPYPMMPGYPPFQNPTDKKILELEERIFELEKKERELERRLNKLEKPRVNFLSTEVSNSKDGLYMI